MPVKKKTPIKRKRRTNTVSPMPYREPTTVRIQKASNGFVVSKHGNTGEVIEVAKTQTEANRIAKKMLGT